MASERRSFPRFPIVCPVEVVLAENGTTTAYSATSSNISRTSIQIEGSSTMVAVLLRQQKLPYTCKLGFTLPWHEHGFTLDAHVVTLRRTSQHHYVLVMLLKHADAEQEQLLNSLLAGRQAIGLE